MNIRDIEITVGVGNNQYGLDPDWSGLLGEFVRENALSFGEIRDIVRAITGRNANQRCEPYTGGGGAAPEWTIQTVEPEHYERLGA